MFFFKGGRSNSAAFFILQIMAILTYSQLDTLCLNCINTPPNYPIYYDNALQVLYDTGCRPMEVFTRSLWSGNDISGYTLTPLKGNSPRYFAGAFTILTFRRWINNVPTNYDVLTYGKALGIFRQFASPYPIFARTKQMDLYCYRYRYVRQLANDGMSVAGITAHMGWAEEEIAVGYLSRPLNYT
jgi:hypothetical protein